LVADHIHRYVETDGAEGHEWRPGVFTLLLTTRGRRSGKLRRTALIYGRDGDAYLVVASQGGDPKHPAWYLNLLAEPGEWGRKFCPGQARHRGKTGVAAMTASGRRPDDLEVLDGVPGRSRESADARERRPPGDRLL
jgi:deazaflavin-dependent oxidoreductase (nitroreductase family)